ncbi:acyl-CoA N-acyltransferase [Pavlovales sp. CCMP2436]|nr:acyl-CoA N-acyltransferase [Pavlovales sp. CCMP2436]
MATSPAPKTMARVEALSPKTFEGARAIQNDFVGARKAMCGVCSYAWCPDSASTYSEPYTRHPETMALTGVALGEDGTVLGFVKASDYGMHRDCFSECFHKLKPGELYIDMLGVSGEARGKGAGTKMLQWAEEQARARGATRLTLAVVAGNPAKRLYERFGFVPTSTTGACGSTVVCCVIGMPHGQCGGANMEKPLSYEASVAV